MTEPSRTDPHMTTGGTLQEAPFAVGEVFFSRTDARGVIQRGNDVFRRVSEHAWDELIGAPHKIIRHDDMPKGVFHIVWDKIQRGEVVGAYIKNRTKNGRFYWVFAVLTPVRDGFVSARIKPTSKRLMVMQDLYAKARERERDQGVSAEDSAAYIIEQIADLGYENYDSFACDSIADELLAERDSLGLPQHEGILHARDMLKFLDDLSTQSNGLIRHFDTLTRVPRNLRIQSRHIEPTGGPLTALSSDYGRMSYEMSVWFTENVFNAEEKFDCIAQNVKDALLFNSAAEILNRCCEQLLTETTMHDHAELEIERAHLADLAAHYSARAKTTSEVVATEAARLTQACKDMRRTLMGLNMVRTTGKIETARLKDDAAGLGEIIAQLGRSQQKVEEHLNSVRAAAEQIAKSVYKSSQKNDEAAVSYQRRSA